MACLIATHPLHVCTVRAVAQFVGKEDKYDGVLGAIVAIYKEDGILGKPSLITSAVYLTDDDLTIMFSVFFWLTKKIVKLFMVTIW